MIGKKNIWERYLEYEIGDLDNFKIPANKVLIEYDPSGTEKTIGGIMVVKEMDFASHANRTGKVVKLPNILYCQVKDPGSMPWKCDIDIKVGDEIYMVHSDSYNCYLFGHNGKHLKLVDYSGILLAKEGENVKMCNGYVLLEKVFEKNEKFGFKETENERYGIVKAIGKPNTWIKGYDKNLKKEILRKANDINLKIGEKVYIHDVSRVFDLEDYQHAKFDNRKIYKVCSRDRISAKVGF